MIEKSEFDVPPDQEHKYEKTEEEKRQAAETLAYLESLPWQPFDVEW